MIKIYQKEWHNIKFDSFSKVSSKEMADPDFYRTFYRIFFERYKSPKDLDPDWLALKKQTALFLKRNAGFRKDSRILSIGCGLGIIEEEFLKDGFNDLEITEVGREPLQWLLPLMPAQNSHIGLFPDCIPGNTRYDFIYLAGVECFFDRRGLIDLLKAVSGKLQPEGRCLVISWAFMPVTIPSFIVFMAKELIKTGLHKAGLLSRGQFWGYSRKISEFHDTAVLAGFKISAEGFLEKKGRWDTYWIELKRNI